MNRLCGLSEGTEISGCTTRTAPGFRQWLYAFVSCKDSLLPKSLVPTEDPKDADDAKEKDGSLISREAGCDAT